MRVPPTHDELERFYRAALAFHGAETWKHAGPDRYVAVENPETGIVAFVVVGDDLYDDGPGAIVLLDAEGLRVHDAIEHVEESAYTDLILRRKAVTLGFEPAATLDSQEAGLIDSVYPGNRPDPAPVVVLDLPGMIPLLPNGEFLRLATIAIEQAIETFPRLSDAIEAHPGFLEIPVRVLTDGVWRDDWRSLDEVIDVDYGPPVAVRPEWSKLARTIKRHSAEWEFGAMLLPSQFGPGPELTCLHMILDGEEVIASSTEPHREAEGLCEFLAATIQEHAIAPRSLIVADPVLANAVSALARVFRIDVELLDHLPTIGPNYAESIKAAYGSEGFEDDFDDDDEFGEEYDEADDEPEYDLPTGTRTIEMPAGFRRAQVTVNYDVEEEEEVEPEEASRIAEAFERLPDDPEAALGELGALIERYPENETLHIALMSTLASVGRRADARTAAEQARERFPQSFEMRVAHANLLVELDDGPAALAALGGATELADLFPDRTEFGAGDLLLFHTSLYRIHAVLGQFDQASADLEVLNSILPGHPDFVNAAESHARMRASVGNGDGNGAGSAIGSSDGADSETDSGDRIGNGAPEN